MTTLQTRIAQLTRMNPAGIEASMRIAHDDPAALSAASVEHECRIAEAVERMDPGYLARCAETMGLDTDFALWEARGNRAFRVRRALSVMFE